MYLKRCIAGGLAVAMLALPACVLASQPEPTPNASGGPVLPPPATRAEAPSAAGPAAGTGMPLDLGAPAAADQLDSTRGGTELVAAGGTLSGAVSGNAATQVATGNNVIQSGSLANATGLPVVIQNSGANVLIQSATVINLQLK
jgi:hypothetical protein